MTTPEVPASSAGWSGVTASVRGASHERNGKPNQDAVRLQRVDGPVTGLIAAVADGHGGERYSRSDRGSHLAVEVACQVGAIVLTELGDGPDPETIRGHMKGLFAESVVAKWTERVLSDILSNPARPDPGTEKAPCREPLSAVVYGSTLLVAIFARGWMGLAQLGDGDIVTVTRGEVDSPVPGDERLIGNETTSLCLPSAAADVRAAAFAGDLPEMVMLTTDGYANSFASPSWRSETARDLLQQVTDKSLGGVKRLLPGWLKESADAGGDDVSMALVVRDTGL